MKGQCAQSTKESGAKYNGADEVIRRGDEIVWHDCEFCRILAISKSTFELTRIDFAKPLAPTKIVGPRRRGDEKECNGTHDESQYAYVRKGLSPVSLSHFFFSVPSVRQAKSDLSINLKGS